MLLNLSHEGIAKAAFQGALVKGYGFYSPPVPQRIDASRSLAVKRDRRYVLKDASVHLTEISNNFNRQLAKLVEQVSEQATIAGQWKRHVLNPNAPSDVDSLTETVEIIMDYVAKFGPGALDLSGLSSTGVHCEHLASVLRATSFWQNEVPGWTEALMVAREACEHAGHDVDDVLFGMV